MDIDLRRKYIDDCTNLIFSKYFYRLVLEKKYIENFGDIELNRMRKIYDTMIINKKLEATFFMPQESSVTSENLLEYNARKEYFDLERQILELEENIKKNDKEIKELTFYLSKNIKDRMEMLVSRTSPLINKNSKAVSLWTGFNKALEDANWKIVFNLSSKAKEIRLLKTKDNEDELLKEIENIKEQEKKMRRIYPFNQEEILENEEILEEKILAGQKDLKGVEESYLRMADYYLSSTQTPRWYS